MKESSGILENDGGGGGWRAEAGVVKFRQEKMNTFLEGNDKGRKGRSLLVGSSSDYKAALN